MTFCERSLSTSTSTNEPVCRYDLEAGQIWDYDAQRDSRRPISPFRELHVMSSHVGGVLHPDR